MVIRKPKPIDIKTLEVNAEKEVVESIATKRKLETDIEKEKLSANFYFTVVFATQKERDVWCVAKGLTLRDNDYITSIDF